MSIHIDANLRYVLSFLVLVQKTISEIIQITYIPMVFHVFLLETLDFVWRMYDNKHKM